MTTSSVPPNPSESTGSNPQIRTIIGFSCFGLILCIAAFTLTMGFYYLLRVAQSATTFTPSTPWAPPSVLAPTPRLATEPIPTKTPPIQGADLPPAEWPLVLADSFDTNANDWPDFSDLSGTEPEIFDVRDGKYVWSVQSAPDSLGIGWPFWANGSPEVSDFYASVEANVTGEIKDATYGLIFRAGDTGHYAFGLNDQGRFTVEAIIYNQANNLLIRPTENAAIHAGEANRLSVAALGTHLMFYINDQLVAELDDNSLQRGFVGVQINLEDGNALANVEFDNFELRAP